MKTCRTKLLIIVLLPLLAAGCVKKIQSVKTAAPEDDRQAQPQIALDLEIQDVRISTQRFNPTLGESVDIRFKTTRPCKSIVQIFSPDFRLITELGDIQMELDGVTQRLTWDGKDSNGIVVPDEGYFITIESYGYSGQRVFYDPTVFSGGEFFNPEISYDPISKTLNYTLDSSSRIRLRAGIHQGPLLNSLMNWMPKCAGTYKDPWDGTAAGSTTSVVNMDGFRLFGEAFTLPDNSIISVGNSKITFEEYRRAQLHNSPRKIERPLFYNNKVDAGDDLRDLITTGVFPDFSLSILDKPNALSSGSAKVRGNVPVQVKLDEDVYRNLTEDRYEIICYVDFMFSTEMEEGYSPAIWMWDSTHVPNGVHILTVNVASYPGHVESKSIEVIVEN
jgi:hypothetical protein